MTYKLSEAAKRTGKARSTIFRAIKDGTISGFRDERNQWCVDPVELHRIFPPVQDTQTTTIALEHHATSENSLELHVIKMENEHLKARLEEYRLERESWKQEASQWQEMAQRLVLASPEQQDNHEENKGFWYYMKAAFAGGK